MGNCIKRAKLRKQKCVTIAIFGVDNAGKSTIVKSLQGGSLEEVTATVGFDTTTIRMHKWNVTIYDLGGGPRIRDIWKNYLSELHGLVYVVDASNHDRLHENYLQFKALLEHPQIQGKPVLLLLNKQDKPGAIDEVDATEKLDLENIVNTNRCPCRVETCSALKGTGKQQDAAVSAGFQWLLDYMQQYYTVLEQRVQKDIAEQKERLERERQERMERVRKIREEREKNGEAVTVDNEQHHADEKDVNPFKSMKQIRDDMRSKDVLNGKTSSKQQPASVNSLPSPKPSTPMPMMRHSGHHASHSHDADGTWQLATSGQVPKLPPIHENVRLGAEALSMNHSVSNGLPPRRLPPRPPQLSNDDMSGTHARIPTPFRRPSGNSQESTRHDVPLQRVPSVDNQPHPAITMVPPMIMQRNADGAQNLSDDSASMHKRRRRRRFRRGHATAPSGDSGNGSDDDSGDRTSLDQPNAPRLSELRSSEPRPVTPLRHLTTVA